MRIYLLMAWRNIWRNRRRTLITLASVVFAVFFSCLLQSMHQGAWSQMIDNAVRFYSGYIQVHQRGYWDDRTLENSFADLTTLRRQTSRHPNILAVVPRLESFALASGSDRTKGVMVIGIDPEKENELTSLKSRMKQGRYLQLNQDKALLSEGLAGFLKLLPGDTIVLISQGYHGANAAGKYEVAGILRFPSPQLNNQLVYLPLPQAQNLYATGRRLTSLALLVKNQQQVAQTRRSLQQELQASSFEVMDWREMMPELVQGFEIDNLGGQVILYILYAVVGFGIFGIFLMMTTERRYEMGVMISIGMGRRQLQFTMVLEILLLALGGTLLGIAISLPVILYLYYHPIPLSGNMAEMYLRFGMEPIIPFSRQPGIFLEQAYVIAIMTAILGIYPLWYIQRLQAVKALRK